MQAALLLTSSGTSAPPVPDYIPGGGFKARLSAAQSAPHTPKLPGGQHYLASDLRFVPPEQQSIAGKVQRVAGFLFGGFDPTCKNLEYELAKTRGQMLDDGYTMSELEQRAREHHCN